MSNISAIVAGIVFVALAAANVVVMLEASQPSQSGARLYPSFYRPCQLTAEAAVGQCPS
jgi:hypothetical protein